MTLEKSEYPITYQVDMPETLSRWMWLIKWILVIPQMIILAVIGFVAMILVFLSWFIILITGKHPRGIFDFVLKMYQWNTRVGAYAAHFTDVYPGFDMGPMPEYPARLNIEYAESRNRLTTFFRYLLAIPHLVILNILGFIIGLVWLIHVVIVVVTGKPNADIFKFLVGYNRWNMRAYLYVLLMTDEYPPFSLD